MKMSNWIKGVLIDTKKDLGWKDFVRDKIKGDLTKGDYVLATKYSDGDPNDQWAVGFFDHVDERGRYIVVDDEGKSFRISGFRKCKKISSEEGEAILRGEKIIYLCQIGLWEFLERYRRIKNDL